MAMKKTALLILALVLSFGTLLVASADTPTAIPSHTVTLEGCTIGEGEIVTYTTVSSEFANAQLPEGFYAGELTLEITGPIVVERGGHVGHRNPVYRQ